MLRGLELTATAGEVALLLGAATSTATPHVRALEAAGLVRRVRRGRHVLVERTVLGTELIRLYERP
jgi:DNA-binding MarR family transcriptional regulator